MILQQQQAKFTHDISVLIQYIFTNGYSCTFGDAYRSPEQATLNAAKGIGIKNSLHCKRLAVDLNLFDEKDKYIASEHPMYLTIGTYWKFLDKQNAWGGDWQKKDLNHFERMEIK